MTCAIDRPMTSACTPASPSTGRQRATRYRLMLWQTHDWDTLHRLGRMDDDEYDSVEDVSGRRERSDSLPTTTYWDALEPELKTL
jgi:hypothetical protein